MQQPGVAGAIEASARAAPLAAAGPGLAGALDEAGHRQHLAVEVAGVQVFYPDRGIDLPQLGDREVGLDERGRQRGYSSLERARSNPSATIVSWSKASPPTSSTGTQPAAAASEPERGSGSRGAKAG